MHRISPGASYQRLNQLLTERLTAGADKAKIDQHIWELFGEQWCVVFTDLSGFSRGVASFGIIHFLQVIHESFAVLTPVIEAHNGFLLKAEGDSMFLLFRRPEAAAECCVQMQKTLQAHNVKRSDAEKILLCAGIGWGRMLRIGDEDIFGAEVNAASKLGEDVAKAGEILVTGNVEEALRAGRKFAPIAEVPPGCERAFRLIY